MRGQARGRAKGQARGQAKGLAALALLVLLPFGAMAEEGGWIGPAELRPLILDSTVTGRYDNGEPYSEYHAPDGRVLGHNNRVPNEEACWDLRGDQVCYYYSRGRALGEFCWRFQRLGEQGIRARLVNRGREIIGIRQAGNPHGHDDGGRPWTCDQLTSERPPTPHGPHRPGPRLAGR